MNDENDPGPAGRLGNQAPGPVPREWLPEAMPPEGHPVWELKVARIMATAGAELGRLADGAGASRASWLSEMGNWWRPAAALAAAALALLATVDDPRSASPAIPPQAVSLGLIVADGNPTALWAALGVPADPVLAILVFEDHAAMAAPAGPVRPSGGGIQ